MAARCQNRPLVVVPEELVGNLAHVHQVFRIGADAPQNAEDGLHEQRRLHELAVEEVCQGVEVPDVIALELEARAVAFAQLLKNFLNK